jgi:heavy metal efflux system protein
VPFSLAGGLVALYVRDINLSVSAAVGFISLFGVAVMSGVLYISDVNRRRPDREVSVALARGIGSDIQRPLATVVVGGLLSTLLLTLGVLPAAYRVSERLRKP